MLTNPFRRIGWAVVAVLLLAIAPCGAEERRADAIVGVGYVLPSAANVQGQFGAYFKTKVTLVNNNPQAISILAVLLTPNGALSQIIQIPGQTFSTYSNFLDDVFGYVGGGGVALGETTGPYKFGVVAEVYVDSANGRYSTPLTAMFSDDGVIRPGSSGRSTAFGLHADGNNRVNLGCSNLATVPATVRVDVAAITNGVRTNSTLTLNLGATGWTQVASPIAGDRMFIDFRVISGGSSTFPVYCYGVNVNNASNDGTAIPAAWTP